MKGLRVCAKPSSFEPKAEWNRTDLRRAYRELRQLGMRPFDARCLIADVLLAAHIVHANEVAS